MHAHIHSPQNNSQTQNEQANHSNIFWPAVSRRGSKTQREIPGKHLQLRLGVQTTQVKNVSQSHQARNLPHKLCDLHRTQSKKAGKQRTELLSNRALKRLAEDASGILGSIFSFANLMLSDILLTLWLFMHFHVQQSFQKACFWLISCSDYSRKKIASAVQMFYKGCTNFDDSWVVKHEWINVSTWYFYIPSKLLYPCYAVSTASNTFQVHSSTQTGTAF